MENRKIKILFESWTKIPHSYSIVNCFHLIYLYKNFSEKIDFYLLEKEYYNSNWKNIHNSFLPIEYSNIIEKMNYIKNDENEVLKEIDLIFRLCYPYNLNLDENLSNKPICLFYTSEFGKKMDYNNFIINNKDINEFYVKMYFEVYNNFYFLTPSKWSSLGLNKYINENMNYKNKIISHGVDTNLFYRINCENEKNKIYEKYEKKYKIDKNDFLMIQMGAQTLNKGIYLILESLYFIVYLKNNKNVKLILKMMKNMYSTENNIYNSIKNIILKYNNNIFNQDLFNEFMNNHIIFIDEVLDFENINKLFNICDLYIYPFSSEGFGLSALEALSSGLNILIPKTGSLEEVMNDIKENTKTDLIEFVDSKINDEYSSNIIQVNDIILKIEELYNKKRNNFKSNNNYEYLIKYINENYSWNSVSYKLYDYLNFIYNDFYNRK